MPPAVVRLLNPMLLPAACACPAACCVRCMCRCYVPLLPPCRVAASSPLRLISSSQALRMRRNYKKYRDVRAVSVMIA